MGAVGEARPTPSALEMKSFHERKFHRSGGMTADKPCVVGDDFTAAIVTGMGISKVEEF